MSENGATPRSEASRRRFLEWALGGFAAVGAALLAWPLAGMLIRPRPRRLRSHFAKVQPLQDIPGNQPVQLNFPYQTEDAYVREFKTHDVWVVKRSESDVTVFSPICTHLACRYNWSPDANHFVCPCHGSVYSITGKVLAGPAPRPLDKLPHKIDKGTLYVEWEQFKPGIPTKVRV